LSLAIGKKGQNVRLAAKLTGWRIDIKNEEEKRKEVEAQLLDLEGGADVEGETLETGGDLVLPDIHDEVVSALRQGGFSSAAQIIEAGRPGLEVLGFDGETIDAVLDAAQAAAGEAEAAGEAPADGE
jgi:N utilization substance protein A